MAKLRTRKWLLSAFASLICLLAVGFYALAQAPDEGKRDRKVAVTGGTFHALPATLETTQWGWLDPNEPPKLVVNSGDTVAVETMMHAHNKVQPGTTMDEIIALRKANPGGGPHSLTGPIYVNGAEPGDVMEIRILKITPKAFATNFNLPGKEFPTIGALAAEMPDGFVKYFYLDLDKKQAEFKPGITIDLQPFPGTLAVGIDPKDPSPRKGGSTDPMAPVSTLRPWKNGSNMDINELQAGHDHLHPDLPQGRSRVDGRLALPPGQRRGESHRARVLVPRDRHAAHRAQGHEARLAAHRDADPLDHDRVRRGSEQGDGQRGARDGGLPHRPEGGAVEPLRGLLAHLHGGRLPGEPGGGRPQGRALHGAQERLRQEVVVRGALAGALLWLAAAPAWGGGTLVVVTTSTDLKALVEAVGGPRVRVVSLAPPLHDPHSVEVKPGALAELKAAALLVRIGLDHEPWLARPLRAVGDARLLPGGAADLDVSRGIALLDAETPRVRPERGVHVHGFGNPHYWLDPENARPITERIQGALARLSPGDAALFEANRAQFLRMLDAGLTRWRAALAPYQGTRVVVAHESWPYFARRFGLTVVASLEPTPGVPPSAAYLAALTGRMKASGVRLIIAEPSTSASLVAQVAARAEARAVILIPSVGGDPAARDYLSLFDVNVARLAAALAAR